jgi:LysM repeat protein
MSLNAENGEDRKAFNFEAKKSLEYAVRLNPANGLSWYRLGYVYSSNKFHLYDYLNTWLPLADNCFDVVMKCAPKNEHLLLNMGRYWVWRARLLPENPMAQSGQEEKNRALSRKQGIHKFQEHFQRLLAINPVYWEETAQQTWEYFPSDSVVLGIVPDTNEALKSQVLRFLAKLPAPETLPLLPQTASQSAAAIPSEKPEVPEPEEASRETALKEISPLSTAVTQASESEAPAGQNAPMQYHTVRSGENLYRIGLRYGLTVEKIRLLNKLDKKAVIRPGQKLLVSSEQ